MKKQVKRKEYKSTIKNKEEFKLKKNKTVLSFLLSLVIICTMNVSFGLTAKAEGPKPYIDVTTEEELLAALQTLDAMDYAYINVINDIVVSSKIKIGKAYFNLNGNSITADTAIVLEVDEKLILDGQNGSIAVTGSRKRGNPAIEALNRGRLEIRNTTISGGDGTMFGGQGILTYGNNTVILDNCNVSSGNSAMDQLANSAAFIWDTTIYINNCQFTRGTGLPTKGYALIEVEGTCSAYDFENNSITFPDYKTSVLSYGPSTTKDVNTLVTAKANIPAPTYTVTIPETIDFGSQKQALAKYRDEDFDQFSEAILVENEFTVSATDVKNLFNDLDNGKADFINVTVTFDGKLKGTGNEVNEVPFTLTQNGTKLTTGNKIATFYNDADLAIKGKTNSANATITMNRCDIINADSYIGTIIFTIAVADRVNG